MTTVTILSHDPGMRNYAAAVVQGKRVGDRLRVKIVANKLLENMVTQMKDAKALGEEAQAHLREVFGWGRQYRPDAFYAERYMARGRTGLTIEVVNFMLGSTTTRMPVPSTLLSAATWKNEMARQGLDLKAMYKQTRTTPHQLDAALIGIYGCLKQLGGELSLDADSVIAALEATSLSKLKREKTK